MSLKEIMIIGRTQRYKKKFAQTKHEGIFRDYKLIFKDSTNRALMSPEDAIKLVSKAKDNKFHEGII